ncbi:MAG: poly-beta-1,6-N-acetyl-D-glucosamine N-deacetylase PgaB [Gammaproteobacteria bacterium]|jgi:biofilm PGA synthesis lipoprotein PgaB
MTIVRLLALCFIVAFGGQASAGQLTVLIYHDVNSNPGDDAYAVSRSSFVAQMDYLETNGYRPVTLEFLDKVSQGKAVLPNKAVLLTFDDGLQSYRKFVAPVLQIYGYPSVLSVVSGWVDGNNKPPEYHDKLLSWPELKKLNESPMIELISHTHDLHTGVMANPQGNKAPAAVTRIYSPSTKSYETETDYRQRIASDLKIAVTRFKQELGVTPLGITWPYGRYNDILTREARLLGIKFQLTLNDGPNSIENFPRLNRIMVMRDTGINEFVADLNYEPLRDRTYQFIEVALDELHKQPPDKREQLLSSLLDNISQLDVNTVILSPFTRDGKAAFFPNDQMPVAADILHRVTHQLHNAVGINHVYLRLPEQFKIKNATAFYNNLARLVWFNGIVFDNQTPDQVKMISKIVKYHHPRVQLGHYDKARNLASYDFVIVPVTASRSQDKLRDQLLEAKGVPTKLFVHLKIDQDDTGAVPHIMETLRALGIKHYGIASGNDLYGYNESNIAKEMAKGTLAVFGG